MHHLKRKLTVKKLRDKDCLRSRGRDVFGFGNAEIQDSNPERKLTAKKLRFLANPPGIARL